MSYAIMRHAREEGEGYLEGHSVRVCERNILELLDRLEDNSVIHIFHSPIRRAVLTAGVVYRTIKETDFSVEEPDALEFLSLENRKISKKLICEAMSETMGRCTFAIFISHQPDIEKFLNWSSDVNECSIFSSVLSNI